MGMESGSRPFVVFSTHGSEVQSLNHAQSMGRSYKEHRVSVMLLATFLPSWPWSSASPRLLALISITRSWALPVDHQWGGPAHYNLR